MLIYCTEKNYRKPLRRTQQFASDSGRRATGITILSSPASLVVNSQN